MITIGQRIREAREAQHLTRRALSIKCGYTDGSICDWEHDRCKPSERALRAVEQALGKKLRR